MTFTDPHWLFAGLAAGALLIGSWRRHDRRQLTALSRFVSTHLQRKLTDTLSPVRRWIQRLLFLAATLALFAALAGPELGFHWEEVTRRGNEVVFAIDTSRSMLTPDVKPNRLARAKLAIDDMARELDGDGVGIVAFAGSAFLVCPLTFDYGAFHQSLDAVDVNTIPLGGTNITTAIRAAQAALRRHAGSDRILILVTDGENLEGDALRAAREAARQDGLKIYTVGVGTAEGDLIPLPADQGGGFVKDEKGVPVRSHLDEDALKAIASATGGAYVHLGGQGEDFERFLGTVFGAVTRHDLIYRQRKIYTPRYQWPLALSLALLLASLMVTTRRSKRPRTPAAVPRRLVVAAVMGVLVTPLRSESADPTTPRVDYNSGTAAYRAGQYSHAAEAFQHSIRAAPGSDAQRLADQEDAYYNLGNALYRAGQAVEKSDPGQAIANWSAALKAYDTALALRRDDVDSRYNRDFVQRKLNELRPPPDSDHSGGGGGDGGGGGSGKSPGKPPGQPPAPSRPNSPKESPPEPGKMSGDEARELLDSAKSSEHPSLPPLAGAGDPKPPSDRTVRNW
jgi:Ca-activated chloride channel family protein